MSADQARIVGGNLRRAIARSPTTLALALISVLFASGTAGVARSVQDGTPAPESLDEERATMIVQVDLYSGRPNPRWTLSRAQKAEVERRLKAMPAATSGEPTQGLGYRGVILSGQGGSTGQPITVLVSAGIVLERFENGAERRKRDVDRALEAWIIGTGSDHLEPSVRDYIMQQIGQR